MDEVTKGEADENESSEKEKAAHEEKAAHDFLRKSNTAIKPSPIVSPYLNNDKRTKPKRPSKYWTIQRHNKTSSKLHKSLHSAKFQALDNSVYYNPKDTPDFFLSSSSIHDQQRKNTKERHRLAKTAVEKCPQTFAASPKACGEMKAVGRTFGVARKAASQAQRVVKTEDGHECKRFTERWQRMIDILLENNRAMKVQNRPDLSPAEEIADDDESTVHIARTAYKAYLKDKHKTLFTKDNVVSEYSCVQVEDKGVGSELRCDSEVVLSKAWETHKRKFEIAEMKDNLGFKSSGELIEKLNELEEQIKVQERLKRIKNMVVSDIAIKSLKAKYNTLYAQIEILRKLKGLGRRGEQKVSVLRQGMINAGAKINLPPHIVQKSEPKETKGNTYLTEVVTAKKKMEEDIKEGKIHVGSEAFPEMLAPKFASQKSVTPTQRSCIENLMRQKWGVCRLKVRKELSETAYYIVLYGERCPLSNCCNSLTVTKIEKNDGCKMCCMNKLCITKLLDWFAVPSEAEEILFSVKLPSPVKQRVKRSVKTAAKRVREEYVMNYSNAGLETSLFNYDKGKGGVGLIIEKKQRMPLIKAKYLSLIVK